MKRNFTLTLIVAFLSFSTIYAQTVLKGTVSDAKTNETLIGASVLIKGTTNDGIVTDYDGNFEFKTTRSLPLTLVVSYVGYDAKEVEVSNARDRIIVKLGTQENLMQEVVVVERGPAEKQKEKPISVITLGQTAIKEAVSGFYNTLGNQPGVDLTTASLGFTVINTRGFNSTSPVRSLQIIDGVDNQAPGLNFSLGNFLGASELDVNKVELIVGASSAFYGPNAFNGVIAMDTKKPFYSKGLSAYVKAGERNLLETAIRYADVVNDKNNKPMLGYKFNLFHFRANDWHAENYDPVTGSASAKNNPGRYDAVNIYGDEDNVSGNQTTGSRAEKIGLGFFHRTGYKEIDLVDYNTQNYKANAALYWRLQPEKEDASAELNGGFNFGAGTTVYQGDNRFRLKNILFLQTKLELKKEGKYFLRAYMTRDNAGNSYDPYATALRLQEYSRGTGQWYSDYTDYWRRNIDPRARNLGYPQPKIIINPDGTVSGSFDDAAADKWLTQYQDSIVYWHKLVETEMNKLDTSSRNILRRDFLYPNSARFSTVFDSIISNTSTFVKGTKFIDRSALYHAHGEYKFEPSFTDEIIVGGNFRLYTPISEGTIFYDTANVKITNREFGFYTGFKKKIQNGRWAFSGTIRVDKNQNFNWLSSPAASMVWNPKKNTYWRFSFSSAIRNPTLTDQYLNLNVGRAILAGNINGQKNMITLESFLDYLNTGQSAKTKYFDIPGVRPEKVKTFETGIRTNIGEKLYVDAGYYFSLYNNFIGYNIGIYADTTGGGFLRNIQAYRFATNSRSSVTTQGFSIGLDYYLNNHYSLNGNYSWNKLLKSDKDDPIIPAFNTPEHKFNVGVSGKELKIGKAKNFGFRATYKWVQGFTFEGSPQFSGKIPSYGLVDGQINYVFNTINTTLKVGCSNILNNRHYEVYGGPLIGRLGYISLTYNLVKN